MIFLECPGNHHHFCKFLFVNEQNSCSDTRNRYRNNSLTCQLMLSRMRDVLILNDIGDYRKRYSHSSSKISSIIISSSTSISNSNRDINSNSISNSNINSNRNNNFDTAILQKTSRKSTVLNTTRRLIKITFEITLMNWLPDEVTFVKGEAWSKTIVPVTIITILNPIYTTKAKAEIMMILTAIVLLISTTKVLVRVISTAIGVVMTNTKRKSDDDDHMKSFRERINYWVKWF